MAAVKRSFNSKRNFSSLKFIGYIYFSVLLLITINKIIFIICLENNFAQPMHYQTSVSTKFHTHIKFALRQDFRFLFCFIPWHSANAVIMMTSIDNTSGKCGRHRRNRTERANGERGRFVIRLIIRKSAHLCRRREDGSIVDTEPVFATRASQTPKGRNGNPLFHTSRPALHPEAGGINGERPVVILRRFLR